MPDFTVARRGTDTSGRAILATAFFWLVWRAALADPRLAAFRQKIVVVQAAFMARLGGGATASAGYHDLGGCWDVRTWNLTLAEQATLWKVMAEYGIWFWKRDPAAAHGGMDEHGHAIAGWDQPLASGAATQWQQAKNGRDGLAGNAPDYMHREGPLVAFPPAHLIEGDPMAEPAALQKLDDIEQAIKDLTTKVENTAEQSKGRDQRLRDQFKDFAGDLGGIVDMLTELTDTGATADQVRAVKQRLLKALAAAKDVDGADNPAPQD